MNLGNLIIVILILLLFICFSVESPLIKPATLLITLFLLILFIFYIKKEKFSDTIVVSEEYLNNLNEETQQYFIQRNLCNKLSKKINGLSILLQRT
jgi:hypothetical protein